MKKIMETISMIVMLASLASVGTLTAQADDLYEGIYNFACVDGGRYLNVYAGNDWDGVNVCVWDKDGSPEQNFKMVDRGGNKYVLYPTSSNGRVLDANRGNSYSNPLQAGNNIDIWQTNDAPAQEWYIDDRGNGQYTIELVAARGLVVTCDNPGGNGGNCSLQSYTGAANQLWRLIRTDGGAIKKNEIESVVVVTAEPAQVSSDYKVGIYSVKYQGTNLRSGPGLNYDVVTMVNTGTQLVVTAVSGEWGNTIYEGQSCWIRLNGFADYIGQSVTVTSEPISVSTPVPTQKPETSRTGYVYNTDGIVLRVRAEANTNCEVLGTLAEGSSITVKGDNTINGFWKVDYNGRTGYCYGDYITFTKPALSSNLESKLGQRLANFNGAAYNGGSPFMQGCDYSGQCTWYCWGRAYEKTGIRLNTVNNANTWLSRLNTSGARAVWDSNAPRKDSIAVNANGTWGHVMYIEDVVGDTVYYTEANVPMNHVVDSTDGVLKKTTRSGIAQKCNGYIYLN